MSITNVKKNHRTALFIRVTPEANSEANVERRAALVGSLNRDPQYNDGGTIKTDVYTVQGTTVTPGLQDVVVGSAPVELSAAVKAQVEAAGFKITGSGVPVVKAPTGRISSPSLRKAAKSAGYTQVAILDSL